MEKILRTIENGLHYTILVLAVIEAVAQLFAGSIVAALTFGAIACLVYNLLTLER